MKYTERELLERNIIKVDSNNYLVGDVTVNTNEKYYEDCHSIDKIDLSNFKVSDNEVVAITRYADQEGKWNLLITNCDRKENFEGYAHWKWEGKYEMFDDERYYVTHYITEQIRQMGARNVTVVFYLWYTEEQVENYINAIESI